MNATAETFFDRYHLRKDGTGNVKIRITHNRERKYYPTDVNLSPMDFKKAMTGKRRTDQQKDAYIKILDYLSRANDAIRELTLFTFRKFEEKYLSNRDAIDSVFSQCQIYADELRSENRIGTAVSIEAAARSLESFAGSKLRFADVTPAFLQKYEKWMLSQGRSLTTVGIYLRALRSVFNRMNIDKSVYPFGAEKGQYSIPSGRNVKKALTLSEVAQIFSYEAEPGSMEDWARDVWVFLYLCNGMNVKDFCLLKWENIDGDFIKYERSKTIRTKKKRDLIHVSLKPENKEVIRKWGVPSINPGNFIFPHITKNMTAERQREVYQQVTQNLNKYTKRIANKLGIRPVTTYTARHTFATVLKRGGSSTEMISELLGHSDLSTTKSYLDSFEKEAIHRETDKLTAFNKAN